ncbi:MAG: protein kinase [Acidobacteriota bacterium]
MKNKLSSSTVATPFVVLIQGQSGVASETISHYRIIQKLGSGGMGEVYLAEDTQLDRKVAIKFLPPESTADQQAKKRLVREARAAAKLDHPNICSIYEVGEEDGRSFIVMQYVEGETLASVMRTKPLELKACLDIAAQVADALAEAHSLGIIHRDIKPANIMLTVRRQAKVMDFGLAKMVEQESIVESQAETQSPLTEAGMIVGTVPYMSPEQVKSEPLDARSDIFSFGTVLYEMVSGRCPFAAESAAATFSAILTREPPPLARYALEAPTELQRIVSKALAKEREERFQTIKDLQIDLRTLKQELEFAAKQGRSSQPAVTVSAAPTSSGSQTREETAHEPAAITAEAAGAPKTSSAEYLIGEIKRHKRGTLLAVAVPVIAAAALVYFAWGAKPIDSVAILPFVNANADPDTEYLADGIPESIINSLSQLPHLKVMSRNSVFRFKGQETDAQEVGQKLGVRAVLTGRVTQRGDGLAISIELVDVRDNSQIWGQQYNRRLADVFAVQEEIAKEISEKLRLKLTGAERQQLAKRPTENLKAFQYYMQGRAYIQRRTREDLLTAIRYYEKAIEEDPNYALAYAGLADAYVNLGVRGYIAPLEGRRKAEEATRTALALDENLAEAHVALGQAYTPFAPYNLSLGDRELRRAIELSPSLAMAHQYLGGSLLQQGRLDESLEELLKARELDPLSPIIARTVAANYLCKRDYVRALEMLRQANELSPAFTYGLEISVYIQNRLLDEALAELENAKRERRSDPVLILSTGMIYAAQGKRAEALQIIKELEAMSGASLSQAQWIAGIYAALSEKGMALRWLERGLEAGAIGLFFKDEPVWDPIRSDPRFADLLRRMGIPQ